MLSHYGHRVLIGAGPGPVRPIFARPGKIDRTGPGRWHCRWHSPPPRTQGQRRHCPLDSRARPRMPNQDDLFDIRDRPLDTDRRFSRSPTLAPQPLAPPGDSMSESESEPPGASPPGAPLISLTWTDHVTQAGRGHSAAVRERGHRDRRRHDPCGRPRPARLRSGELRRAGVRRPRGVRRHPLTEPAPVLRPRDVALHRRAPGADGAEHRVQRAVLGRPVSPCRPISTRSSVSVRGSSGPPCPPVPGSGW